jgi:serine/threonine protein kinase
MLQLLSALDYCH